MQSLSFVIPPRSEGIRAERPLQNLSPAASDAMGRPTFTLSLVAFRVARNMTIDLA